CCRCRRVREYAVAELGARRDLRSGGRQRTDDRPKRRDFRQTFGAANEVRLEFAPFIRVEAAEHVAGGGRLQLLVRAHAPPSVRTSRILRRPSRIRVLTVPSGCSSRSAISLWLSPS